MRAATRPRLRAAGDAKGGTRRVRSRILLVLALALTGWVAAFARLRRSALSGADDFGIRRSGHREDPRTTTRRTATFDAGRPIHSANTDGREHDTPTSRRVVGVPPNTGATAAPYVPPAEPGGAVTFVLVSTMNPDSAPRVANLLASMRAFLTTDDTNDTSDKEPKGGGSSERVVAELLVLVPDAELDWWALAAAALGADAPWGKTRVVPESRALPTPAAAARALAPGAARREARGLGYRTQMLLKLAAGALVRTPFYVTLDCDVVLRGALRAEDMLDASRRRALAQGAMGGPHAARWLSHSLDALFGETPGAAAEAAKALESDDGTTGSVSTNDRLRSFASKVASCGAGTTSRGVGVTPAILSAALAKRALAFLDEPSARFGRVDAERTRWDARLFRSLDSGLDWTEYGIYAAFACVEGTFGETHFVDATRELYDAELQEDGSKFADAGAMRAAFGAGEGQKKRALFVVVQSIGGSDPVGAASAVRPFLLGDA